MPSWLHDKPRQSLMPITNLSWYVYNCGLASTALYSVCTAAHTIAGLMHRSCNSHVQVLPKHTCERSYLRVSQTATVQPSWWQLWTLLLKGNWQHLWDKPRCQQTKTALKLTHAANRWYGHPLLLSFVLTVSIHSVNCNECCLKCFKLVVIQVLTLQVLLSTLFSVHTLPKWKGKPASQAPWGEHKCYMTHT